MIKKRIIMGFVGVFFTIIFLFYVISSSINAVSIDKNTMYNNWFNDIKDHWANQHIINLVDYGIINGYYDNTFRPNNLVTRVEAVTIITKSLGLEKTSDIRYDFKDKDDIPIWAREYLQTAINNNIIKGTRENYFLPNNKIIRTEVAVILTNSFDIKPTSTQSQYFSDSWDIPTWAVGQVNGVFDAGMISGYQDGTFAPRKFMTRAELCVVVSKSIEKYLLKQK